MTHLDRHRSLLRVRPSQKRALLLCFALACAVSGRATAQTRSGQRYQIEAKLNASARTVAGHERIVWRNNSRLAVSELYFHLYANAFADDRSVFIREGGAKLRGKPKSVRGGIDTLGMRTAGGIDLLGNAVNTLIPNDTTQLRVPLPSPIAPGESIELDLTFRVRLPSLLARMGAADDFFMIAQWFPKLARLEDDGRWASFPYHGFGEFYADFADYELTVELPDDYVLAAPGRLVSRSRVREGTRQERYAIDNAIDIAWVAARDLTSVRMNDGSTEIEVFAPKGHRRLARKQIELLREGLAELANRYGAYPHHRLVLVLPPAFAHGASGMEYPGMILGASVDAATEWLPWTSIEQDAVSAHELAHQWFPMLVATNEVEQPFLDEGLAEWTSLDLLRTRYGKQSFWPRMLGVSLDHFDVAKALFARATNTPSSLLPAFAYSRSQLSIAIYLRPALALESVAHIWGHERLRAALGLYARTHRFGHPGLHDLAAAFDAVYWTGFWDHELAPALSDPRSQAALATNPQSLLHAGRSPPSSATIVNRRPSPLISRLLLLAQAFLGVLGP